MATVVRIKPRSHESLRQIAEITGHSMQEELDRAIEERRRRVYLEGLASDYAALKQDPKAWRGYKDENELWDTASGDGLKET